MVRAFSDSRCHVFLKVLLCQIAPVKICMSDGGIRRRHYSMWIELADFSLPGVCPILPAFIKLANIVNSEEEAQSTVKNSPLQTQAVLQSLFYILRLVPEVTSVNSKHFLNVLLIRFVTVSIMIFLLLFFVFHHLW